MSQIKGMRRMNSKRRRNIKLRKLREQDYKCGYCRNDITYKTATFDHIIPVAHEGNNHVANLVLCCEPCNKQKNDMLIGG